MKHFYQTATVVLRSQGQFATPALVYTMTWMTYTALMVRLQKQGWTLPKTDEGKLFVLDVETPNGFIY